MSNFVSVSDVVIFDPDVSVRGWDVRKSAIGITWYYHKGSKIKTFEKPKPPIPVTQPQVFRADSNLPDDWEEIKDPDGRLFYYHRATKVSKWTRPQGNQLPAGWMECTNPDGRTYYLNTITQATTWDRPAGSALLQSISSQGQSTATFQSPTSVRSSTILETTEWSSSDIEKTTVPAHRAASVPSTLVKTTNWSPSDPLHRPIPTRAETQPLSSEWQHYQDGNRRHSHTFSKDSLAHLQHPPGSTAATKAVVNSTKTAASATAMGVKVAAKKLQKSKNAQRIVAGVGMAAVNAVLINQFGVRIPTSVGTAAVGLVNSIHFDDETTKVVDVTDTGGTVGNDALQNKPQAHQPQRPSQTQFNQQPNQSQPQRPQFQNPGRPQGAQSQYSGQQSGPVPVQSPPGVNHNPSKPLLKPQQKAALMRAGVKIGSSLLKSAIRSSMSGNSGGDEYDYDDNDNGFDFGDTSNVDVPDSDLSNDGGNGFDSNNNFDDAMADYDTQDQDQDQYVDADQQSNNGSGGGGFDTGTANDMNDYDTQDQDQDQYVDADQQSDNGSGGGGFDTGTANDVNDYGGNGQFVNYNNSPDNTDDGNVYDDSTIDQQATDTTGYDTTLSAEAGFEIPPDATYDQQSDVNFQAQGILQASMDNDNASMNGVSPAPDTLDMQNYGSYDSISAPPIDQSFSQDTISDPNTGTDTNSTAADNLWTFNLPDTSSTQTTAASQAYAGLTSASLSGPITDYYDYDSFAAFGGEIPPDQNPGQDSGQDPSTPVDTSGGIQSESFFQDPTLTSAELGISGSLNQDANTLGSPDQSLDADPQSPGQSSDQFSDTTQDPITEFTDNIGSTTPTNSNTVSLDNQIVQASVAQVTSLSQLYDGSAYGDPGSTDNSPVDAQPMTPTWTGSPEIAPLTPPAMPAMPTPDAMPDPALLTVG
jgi:hypothetical protein